MIEQQRSRTEFRRLVHECITKAESRFDVSFGRVCVTFDLKGECAAKAYQQPHEMLGATYKIRFNRDAIRLDWHGMTKSTIPHEVAHLVAFAREDLGADNHNNAWRSIAIALGDIERGEAYHNLSLPPARRTTKFIYENERGISVLVPPRLHRRVQAGECGVSYKRQLFTADHYQGLVKSG